MSVSIFLLVSLSAVAAVEVPQCPGELSAAAVKVSPAQGWTGLVPTRVLLSGAGVVVGPPDVAPRAELRGGARQISKRVIETTYAGLASQEKWLICSYGRGGELEQAHRLPSAAERCVIRVSQNQYNDTEVVVSCSDKS
jgi:hypothetical protein